MWPPAGGQPAPGADAGIRPVRGAAKRVAMKRVLIFAAGALCGAAVLLAFLMMRPAPVSSPPVAPAPPATVVQPPAPPLPPVATPPPPELTPPAPPSIAGLLMIPVVGVNASQLSDTYTQSRGAGRPHEAIDIPAARGTPVVAVDDGRVVKLFNSKPGGLTVYQFDPAEKVAYYYAHLDAYAPGLAEGKALKRGELVGYVGSTGNASPEAPHLHFAIFVLGPEKRWWQGTAINPYPLLTRR